MDINKLKGIGLRDSHVKYLINRKLSTYESISYSINSFHYDLTNSNYLVIKYGRNNLLTIFLGVLKKGKRWESKGYQNKLFYENEKQKAIIRNRDYIDEKNKQENRNKEEIKERKQKNKMFLDWCDSISIKEKDEILKKSTGASYLNESFLLKAYFFTHVLQENN